MIELISVNDEQTVDEWFAGLRREWDDISCFVCCSGCSDALDMYTATLTDVREWKTAHYDCDKEYIEIDTTLLNWLEEKQ